MEIKQAVAALSALAQDSRLAVFRLLVRHCAEGLPAGEIAQRLKIPAATLSFHLKELTAAGLIFQRREGRSIIYALHVEAMRSLLSYLMEDCCQGRPELCQPKYACDCAPKERRRKVAR